MEARPTPRGCSRPVAPVGQSPRTSGAAWWWGRMAASPLGTTGTGTIWTLKSSACPTGNSRCPEAPTGTPLTHGAQAREWAPCSAFLILRSSIAGCSARRSRVRYRGPRSECISRASPIRGFVRMTPWVEGQPSRRHSPPCAFQSARRARSRRSPHVDPCARGGASRNGNWAGEYRAGQTGQLTSGHPVFPPRASPEASRSCPTAGYSTWTPRIYVARHSHSSRTPARSTTCVRASIPSSLSPRHRPFGRAQRTLTHWPCLYTDAGTSDQKACTSVPNALTCGWAGWRPPARGRR
ncbi:hypothetical protein SAMN00790413_04038 [Deinococcus hopiensis KR-140]|uniref:Uncharacterized protein n=1 Tax=Deinococcus hopiensis KR-140 TaxID=695939 RepID=A0A1W1UNA6_9DEIO|nr:hypothetical protein SAMN00790413_04038 [Deinococcus hopiensis KR-140]